MKVLIFIPVYRRPEVVELCFKNLKSFSQTVFRTHNWTVNVVCLLSPEDKSLKKNVKLTKKHGFKAIYFRNLPIADKMNAGIQWIVKNCEFDYLMNFGSDDLIHPKIAELYAPHIAQNRKFFGINSLYFYELRSKKTIFFHTYNFNGSIGAGRMIHSSLIREVVRQQSPMYEPGLCQGLDTSSAMTLKRLLNIVDVGIECGEFPYIVDIKTLCNINPMFVIEARAQNIKPVNSQFLKQYYAVL